jgi:hypothetical protein
MTQYHDKTCFVVACWVAVITIIFVLALILFSGCGSTKEVERVTVRDTVYAVASPDISETLPMHPIDLGWEAYRMRGRDTVMFARVDTVEKTVTVKARPDSIYIVDHDTTTRTEYITQVEETPFLSKIGLVFIGVGLAALAAVGAKFSKLIP